METFHLVGFGDIPATRAHAYDFYRMIPLKDGFPGRRLKDRPPPGNLVPHPIFATYLIRDFLTVEKRRKDGMSLEDAIRVADAAIARMTRVGDALIFYYEDNGLLNVGERFYSGLTQARYLLEMHNLAKLSGHQSYARAAKQILHSLTVPAEQGGVMRRYGAGAVIEEFPHEIPNFVLNGWTTAILQVMQYAVSANDDEAHAFAAENLVALKALLPLFDMPEMANTRYRLSGFMPHRFKGSKDFQIVGGSVAIGGETYVIHEHGHGAEKWTNRVGKHNARTAVLETVLSRVAGPNTVTVAIEAAEPLRLSRDRSLSHYDPFKSFPVKSGWEPAETWTLPAGRSEISFSVPWEDAPMVGYPTNFSKKVSGPGGVRHRNVYHYLHVANLDTLYGLTKDPELLDWGRKWLDYPKRWPTMDIYKHPLIDHAPVGHFRPKWLVDP